MAPISPIEGIYAAVFRRTLDGEHPDGWVPAQRISVGEALGAYTEDGAYASFVEDELGRIETGMLADLAVLSDDIFDATPEAMRQIRIDLTVVGGEVRYRR